MNPSLYSNSVPSTKPGEKLPRLHDPTYPMSTQYPPTSIQPPQYGQCFRSLEYGFPDVQTRFMASDTREVATFSELQVNLAHNKSEAKRKQEKERPSWKSASVRTRSRKSYTKKQQLELEKEFLYSRYLTKARRQELAKSIGLSEKRLKIWFQNRRMKLKKSEMNFSINQGKVNTREIRDMYADDGVASGSVSYGYSTPWSSCGEYQR